MEKDVINIEPGILGNTPVFKGKTVLTEELLKV